MGIGLMVRIENKKSKTETESCFFDVAGMRIELMTSGL